jgi:hypothetical protein
MNQIISKKIKSFLLCLYKLDLHDTGDKDHETDYIFSM